MANLRRLKKDIDYVLEELVFDCDMAFYYQPEKEKEIWCGEEQWRKSLEEKQSK